MILSSKKLHTHYGKDQPEDKANEEHVEDRWNGLNQSIHNDLNNMIFKLKFSIFQSPSIYMLSNQNFSVTQNMNCELWIKVNFLFVCLIANFYCKEI